LNPFYPSAALTFDKSNFWIRYNDTSFGKTATLANLFIVGSALAIFSLLPENAFCSLKGTCYGGKPHFQQRYENYVDKYSTNLAAQYRTDEDEDYLNYPVEYIDRMGLANKRKRRPHSHSGPAQRTHHRRRHQKREAKPEAEAESEAQEFADYIGEYNDHDLSTIPAEHRSTPALERVGRNPIMQSLVELFFGSPIRRVATGWYDVYQHYEDYWRFRLKNPGQSYRKFIRRHPPRNHFAQSRVDSTENIEEHQQHPAEADYVQDPTIQTNVGNFVQHES